MNECNAIDIHANLLACVLAKYNQRSLLLNIVHGTLAKIIIRELTPPFARRNQSSILNQFLCKHSYLNEKLLLTLEVAIEI